MLRLAQGHLALWLVPVAAIGGASAVAGCGLFVDFEDGASAAATQGAGTATAGSGAASSVTAGGAGGGGSGAGAGGAVGDPCKVPDGWKVEVLAQWPDEVVVAMALVDAGGIAVANLTPPADRNLDPEASDTVVRVLYPRPRGAQEFKVSIDNGAGSVRNSVALARGGKGLVVAATASEGDVHTPATPAMWHPGLVAFDLDPASWDAAAVRVECDAVSLESVTVAAVGADRIAVAANTFTPEGPVVRAYDCGGCPTATEPFGKDLLIWPDAIKHGCPVRTGALMSKDASPSLALVDDSLLVSANYTADTEIFGAKVGFGSGPMEGEVDRFVAALSEGNAGPEVAWATPVARTYHGGNGGTFLFTPLDDGFLVGGGLYGWLDPTYTPFEENGPLRPALARLTAAGGLLPSLPLALQPGVLRSMEAHSGCALIAGALASTDLMWMTDPGAGPSFVALIDTQTLMPLGGLALPTGLTGADPLQVFAARGDKGIIVSGVYVGAPMLGDTQLQQASPRGTFVIRVAQP